MKQRIGEPKGEPKGPDYDFGRGLPIGVISYTDENVSQSTLRAQPNAEQDPQRDALVEQQMRDTFLARGLGGRAVEFALVGPEDAERLIYAFYGWGGKTHHPVAVGEAQALAAANPNSQIVFVNTPGAGRSGALPLSVQKEIMRRGHYGPLGEHIAIATEGVWEGRTVSLYGHSLGGRTAIGMVPFVVGGVDRLVVNDPTGAKRSSLLGIIIGFAVKERKHLGEYVVAGFDPAASRRQSAPVARAIRETSVKERGGGFQMLVVDPVGLTRGGFEHDMEEALPNVNTLTRVLSPELSEINDWRYVAAALARLAKYKQPGAVLEQWVLEGHTHSFMAAAPAIEAFLYGTPSLVSERTTSSGIVLP